MIWVIDASVAVRWFIAQENHAHADLILEKILTQPEFFAVPELFCFEVYAVLSRMLPNGVDVYVKGMMPILNCGILRYPMTEVLARQASTYISKGLTGYDACYVSLAKEVGGKWLTFDEKAHSLIKSARLSHTLNKSLPDGWES